MARKKRIYYRAEWYAKDGTIRQVEFKDGKTRTEDLLAAQAEVKKHKNGTLWEVHA